MSNKRHLVKHYGTVRNTKCSPNDHSGTSLEVQWLRLRGLAWWHNGLRIRLPMQGIRVPSLVWEDSTCRGATRPMRQNYLLSLSSRALELQLLSPCAATTEA